MRLKKILKFLLTTLLISAVLIGGYFYLISGRPAPVPVKMKIMNGITYKREVHYFPRPMMVHILIIDKKTKGLHFFVTPPDKVEGGTVKARTTSQFLTDFDLRIAVNGDGFTPWWSRSPVDYYPHAADPVTPNGFAAALGKVYSQGDYDPSQEPTFYISRRNEITFGLRPGKIYQAISGDRVLIQGGEISANLDNVRPDPRTAMGINKNGRWTYLVVVDGRQPFYSQGATFQELAELLKNLGAYYAMSLDGGGSSTMVMADENGQPVILNSPIDNYVPLRERPVANHFGVYIK